jgi:hypothetical protein
VLHSIFSQLSLFLEAGNQATASGALSHVSESVGLNPPPWHRAWLERLKEYCSHSAKGIGRAVFLVFGFVSAQLQGLSNLRLRRSLAKNQKSSLRIGYSIF